MAEVSIEIGEDTSRRWQRPVFLLVSALIVLAVIVLAHDVMLPLVLGLLIAYVLMPLVTKVERKGTRRGVAVVVVYVVVLGTLGTFIRFISPRIGHELRTFAREVPMLTQNINKTWIPAIQRRVYDVTGIAPSPPPPEPGPPEPALIMRPQGDGSFALEVGSGLVVRHTRDGGYVVDKPHEQRERFDPNRFIAESVQSSVSYAQQNALELARIGGGIIAGVSRFFFVFGLTLMIAAYLMLTRERILNFFRSLVRPSGRGDF
ncbi:MAG: AI-2E family transporter, partial [Polyangiaceae bacterium]